MSLYSFVYFLSIIVKAVPPPTKAQKFFEKVIPFLGAKRIYDATEKAIAEVNAKRIAEGLPIPTVS